MYNLLLVDDEVLIADGMYDALCEENMEELYLIKAYSVEETLTVAKEQRIDILLTDINMPDMDGFELYERIVRIWPYCRVIFLTGFQSFDYVYKAIQYKNVRYVIKAEGVDRVLEIVEEVIRELDQSLLDRNEGRFNLEQESKERLIKEIMVGYFNEDIREEELNREELKKLGFEIDLERPICLVGAKFDQKQRTTTYGERIGLIQELNRMLQGHLKKSIQIVPLDLNIGILWLLQSDEGTEESGYFMNTFDLFQIHMKSAFNLDSVIVICCPAVLSEVKKEFRQLYAMLRSQVIQEGSLLTCEELQRIVKQRTISEQTVVDVEESNSEMSQIIYRVEQIVEENLESEISITMLAKELYFNAYYLSRMFKNEKGITLSDYIAERKMERAKKLLVESEHKVQEIGERMGYSSPANFIRSFKKYCKMTPNEYRRLYYWNK